MVDSNDLLGNENIDINSIETDVADPIDKLVCKLIAICRNQQRTTALLFIENVINKNFFARCYPLKSAASNLSLPDEKFDVLGLCYRLYYKPEWSVSLIEKILKENGENKKNSNFKDIEIDSLLYQVKVNKLIINIKDQEISLCYNDLDDVYRTAIFEDINNIISKDNLFKRCVLLIKSWCVHESTTYINNNSKKGIYVMVMCLFATREKSSMFTKPLDALLSFLKEYSKLDFTLWYVTPYGILPKFDVSVSKGMPFPSSENSNNNSNCNIDNNCQSFYDIILKYRLRSLRSSVVSEKFNKLRSTNSTPLDNDNEIETQAPSDPIFIMDSLYPQKNLCQSYHLVKDNFLNLFFKSFESGYNDIIQSNSNVEIINTNLSESLDNSLDSQINGMGKVQELVNKHYVIDSYPNIAKSTLQQFYSLLDTPTQYIENMLSDAELIVKDIITPDSLARTISHLVTLEGRPLTIEEIQRILPDILQIPSINTAISSNFGDFRRFISACPSILQINEDMYTPKVMPSPRPSPGSLWYYPSPIGSTISELSVTASFFGETSSELISSSSATIDEYNREIPSNELIEVTPTLESLSFDNLMSNRSVNNSYSTSGSFINTKSQNKTIGRPPRIDVNEYANIKPLNSSRASPNIIPGVPQDYYFNNSVGMASSHSVFGSVIPSAIGSVSSSIQSSRYPSPTNTRNSSLTSMNSSNLSHGGNIDASSNEAWHMQATDPSKILSPTPSLKSVSLPNYRELKQPASTTQSQIRKTVVSSNNLVRPVQPTTATITDPLSGTKIFNQTKPNVWIPGQFYNRQTSPNMTGYPQNLSSSSSSNSSHDLSQTSIRSSTSQQRLMQPSPSLTSQTQNIQSPTGIYSNSLSSSIASSPSTKRLAENYYDNTTSISQSIPNYEHTQSQTQSQNYYANQQQVFTSGQSSSNFAVNQNANLQSFNSGQVTPNLHTIQSPNLQGFSTGQTTPSIHPNLNQVLSSGQLTPNLHPNQNPNIQSFNSGQLTPNQMSHSNPNLQGYGSGQISQMTPSHIRQFPMAGNVGSNNSIPILSKQNQNIALTDEEKSLWLKNIFDNQNK